MSVVNQKRPDSQRRGGSCPPCAQSSQGCFFSPGSVTMETRASSQTGSQSLQVSWHVGLSYIRVPWQHLRILLTCSAAKLSFWGGRHRHTGYCEPALEAWLWSAVAKAPHLRGRNPCAPCGVLRSHVALKGAKQELPAHLMGCRLSSERAHFLCPSPAR